MLKTLQKPWPIVFIFLIIALVISLLSLPIAIHLLTVLTIITSLSMTILISTQKHWQSYQQAECTREKMTHNLILDLLGLLLTMGAAMYAGRLAGGYFGIRNGFWIGLLAGFAGGFLAAWMVKSAWGKLVSVLA